jgi:hypothetical protein
METRPPTSQEIEALVSFLPRLYAEGFTPIESWGGGTKDKGGIFPMPDYHRDVLEFFRIASSECWCDYDYDPGDARRMLENEAAVKAADLPRIKTMLTYCVRGERFCEGHWGEMIEGGHIRRLLERRAELRIKSG